MWGEVRGLAPHRDPPGWAVLATPGPTLCPHYPLYPSPSPPDMELNYIQVVVALCLAEVPLLGIGIDTPHLDCVLVGYGTVFIYWFSPYENML